MVIFVLMVYMELLGLEKVIGLNMMKLKRKQQAYLLAALVIIFLGLGSRCLSFIPDATGDALWAMMIFCFFRMILVAKQLKFVALVALVFSYVDEFSQLVQWTWLCEIRATTVGHLVLGQGFLWSDLLAYTIGVALAYFIAGKFE